MEKQNKKHTKRVRNLIILFVLTAIIISVSTYAWFIGMRTVNVNTFDVQIAGVDSLMLSLDGDTWEESVSISKANFEDTFDDNTNWWAGRGLIPMSTVGKIDTEASRLVLYEKASLTATPGGYRLMASRTNNGADYLDKKPAQEQPEVDGYVAFDLFIKNSSGRQYLQELNILDEEAIYLSFDSEVAVSLEGVENTGIENSVRVGYAQIGRVSGDTTDAELIQGIECNDDNGESSIVGEVTGICRDAVIWEPNDAKHVAAALSWYNTTCKERTGADLTKTDSYGNAGTCKVIANGDTLPTYAVNTPIGSDDKVDVYDGDFNTYDSTTKLTKLDEESAANLFTDSMKVRRGMERPEFMRLAPNSITKVRIYIWIEGQDIDNYDFASIGKSISVKFGFTKERFEEGDVDYEGPEFRPEITLNPNTTTFSITKGNAFDEPDVTAYDRNDDKTYTDTEIERTVKIGNRTVDDVDTDVPGVYTITYRVTNSLGVTGTKTITVTVTE